MRKKKAKLSVVDVNGVNVLVVDEKNYYALCADKNTDIEMNYYDCGHFSYGLASMRCPVCDPKGQFIYIVQTKTPQELLN